MLVLAKIYPAVYYSCILNRNWVDLHYHVSRQWKGLLTKFCPKTLNFSTFEVQATPLRGIVVEPRFGFSKLELMFVMNLKVYELLMKVILTYWNWHNLICHIYDDIPIIYIATGSNCSGNCVSLNSVAHFPAKQVLPPQRYQIDRNLTSVIMLLCLCPEKLWKKEFRR